MPIPKTEDGNYYLPRFLSEQEYKDFCAQLTPREYALCRVNGLGDDLDYPHPNIHCKHCARAGKKFGEMLKQRDYLLYVELQGRFWGCGSCEIFRPKPDEVYFQGLPCPLFKPIEGEDNTEP